MGTAELSCNSLLWLAQDTRYRLAAVVTQPDKPKGRELHLQPSPVKRLAEELKLPVLQPAGARDEEFIAELRGLKPDLIVVVAYGHILPQAILDLPRHGCLNVHASLLPKYRGAAPIQWAVANGETETGVTIMQMDAGLDTGPILSQRGVLIRPSDDSQTLHDQLDLLGAELLLDTIPDYVAGKIQPQPQPAEGISYAPKIKREDGHIDWNLPAQTILNRLRAFTPWPGAFTSWLGVPPLGGSVSRAILPPEGETPNQPRSILLKIWKAEVMEGRDSALRCPDAAARRPDPGEILSADKTGIVVACGQNALRILELQREGGKRLTAGQFLAGHPLRAGEKFRG